MQKILFPWLKEIKYGIGVNFGIPVLSPFYLYTFLGCVYYLLKFFFSGFVWQSWMLVRFQRSFWSWIDEFPFSSHSPLVKFFFPRGIGRFHSHCIEVLTVGELASRLLLMSTIFELYDEYCLVYLAKKTP